MTISETLAETQCGELMGSSCTALTQIDPICLSSSLSVVEGCSALAKHRIQSAPVYDADAQGFIGILDFRDLVAYVLQVFHKVPKEPVSIDTTADIKDIVKLALGAGNHGVSVKAIANLSGLNPLVSVNSSSPISEAIQQLCKSGVHRVIVIHHGSTGSNDFVGVLSQSTICAFIASRLGPIGHRNFDFWPNARKSLVDLGLVRGGIISITSAETVLDALAVMHKNRISSVAIVDHENGYNQLIGTISMSDMKDMFSVRGGFKSLNENVFKFFQQLRSTQGLENSGNDRIPNFVCSPLTLIVDAIERMTATRIHRLWVVDGDHDDRVVGVVSLSDLMQLFAKEI